VLLCLSHCVDRKIRSFALDRSQELN
jgi:hypothetical protein